MDKVRFREEDVRKFIARIKLEKQGIGGRSTKEDDKIIATIRIAEMALNGEFTARALAGEKAFLLAFHEGLSREHKLNLTDASLRPLVRAIRNHFRPLIDEREVAIQSDPD